MHIAAIGNARVSTRGIDNSDSTLVCVSIEPSGYTKSSDMTTLSNVETRRGESNPPSVRFAPDAFPETESSKTGVSVRYAPAPDKRWYVFRVSYGREDKASDFMVEDGTYTYIAKKIAEKYVDGKRKSSLCFYCLMSGSLVCILRKNVMRIYES